MLNVEIGVAAATLGRLCQHEGGICPARGDVQLETAPLTGAGAELIRAHAVSESDDLLRRADVPKIHIYAVEGCLDVGRGKAQI